MTIEEALEAWPCKEHREKFMNSPHPRLGGRTPKQAIDDGDADTVLELLERIIDGNPV